jgi:hypothetical protein
MDWWRFRETVMGRRLSTIIGTFLSGSLLAGLGGCGVEFAGHRLEGLLRFSDHECWDCYETVETDYWVEEYYYPWQSGFWTEDVYHFEEDVYYEDEYYEEEWYAEEHLGEWEDEWDEGGTYDDEYQGEWHEDEYWEDWDDDDYWDEDWDDWEDDFWEDDDWDVDDWP